MASAFKKRLIRRGISGNPGRRRHEMREPIRRIEISDDLAVELVVQRLHKGAVDPLSLPCLT
jgi:hypothetical protein